MKGPFSIWVFFGVTIWIDIMTILFFMLFLKKKKRERVKEALTKKRGEVSVLIPVHRENSANIINTIESIYEEGYPLKKVIICSDEDSTYLKQACLELGKKHPNFIYIESPSRSKAKKVNFIVEKYGKLLGEVLYVRDCRVRSENDCINKMMQQFDSPNVGAVTSYGYLSKPKNFLSRSYHYGKNWVNEIGRFRKRAQDVRSSVFVVCGASTMYKVSVLEKFPIPHNTKTEDTHYTWILQFNGYKINVADDAIVSSPDIDGSWFEGIIGQINQSYRWCVGTIQCLYLERKSFKKSKKLAFTTILPGFLEAFTYSIALVLIPMFLFVNIGFAIGFIIGDMFFSLLGTLILIPKRFFHTLWHYPQIAFFKYINSVIFVVALIVVTLQNFTNKKKSWSNEWTPAK